MNRSFFTPETPLGQDVQAILIQHPEGLRLDEIRRLLRRERSLHVSLENLRELLGDVRAFSLLPDDRYVLAGSEQQPSSRQAASIRPSELETVWDGPLIVNLPCARTDYVVFDLETTGTDPSQDRIIQIAALKVAGGLPVAARNWYVNPGDVAIPYTVKTKLHMIETPALEKAITDAPSLDTVMPEFQAFVGDLPLVAHNARFDGRFLAAALGLDLLPTPMVDNLELALLLYPNLASHQLSRLAESTGLQMDLLESQWTGLSLDTNFAAHHVSSATFHDAVTDVYVLFRIYERLLQELDENNDVRDLVKALLPEAFELGAEYTGIDPEELSGWRARCDWSLRPGDTTSAQATPDPDDLLTNYLAAKGHRPRTGQLEMQSMVTSAMANDQYAMIEAPTGTGKTLAYLTAAVYSALTEGRRVALSTAYRNLQDQLLGEIRGLQRSGVVAFRSQLLKGVGNYLCWSQIARYLDVGASSSATPEPSLTVAERYVLAYIVLWLPGSTSGTTDELSCSTTTRLTHRRQLETPTRRAVRSG